MRNAARLGVWATCVCVLMLAHASLSAGSTLPTPWVNQDIGSVGLPGSASAAGGVFTVSGAGADIYGSADAFQAVMQPITGDVQIVARVASIQNTNTYAKAGIMLRSSLTAGSAHVILDVRPNGSIEFMVRSASSGSTNRLSGSTQVPPRWLKLTRTGAPRDRSRVVEWQRVDTGRCDDLLGSGGSIHRTCRHEPRHHAPEYVDIRQRGRHRRRPAARHPRALDQRGRRRRRTRGQHHLLKRRLH